MNRPNISNTGKAYKRQQGVALVIALILLFVVTLVGLAGIQSSSMQERMSSNMYDRSIAMQAAEAALRAAEAALTANADNFNKDCTAGVNQCDPFPPSTFIGGADSGINWVDVGNAYQLNDALSAGTAQYHIQLLGVGSSIDELGLTNSANTTQYDAGGGVPQARYYQVIVRSQAPDPDTTADDGRAIVVLSAGYRRDI